MPLTWNTASPRTRFAAVRLPFLMRAATSSLQKASRILAAHPTRRPTIAAIANKPNALKANNRHPAMAARQSPLRRTLVSFIWVLDYSTAFNGPESRGAAPGQA